MLTRTTNETTVGQIETLLEIVTLKQVVRERPVDYPLTITSTWDAANIGIREIGDESHEVVLVAALSTSNNVNALYRVFTGSLSTSTVHPREIFQMAMLNNAARILIWHCHPSGRCSPSTEDVDFTQRMKRAGELLRIELLDHIIVGGKEYLSMKEDGII